MERERFEQLVARAVDSLPEELRDRMENVDIIVADQPTEAQLAILGEDPDNTLLGLYEGVPLTERSLHYGLVMPDKITIFQRPIEAMCRSDTKVVAEIQKVVRHEIAHHFGISDARLKELGMD